MKPEKDLYIINKEGEIEKKERVRKKKRTVKKEGIFGIQNLDIGFYLLTPILAGVFFGLYLDRKLYTKPIFTISLILLGAVASLYNLFKLTKK
jgi:F0F1-type ATP synthase assembly protein I